MPSLHDNEGALGNWVLPSQFQFRVIALSSLDDPRPIYRNQGECLLGSLMG